MTKKLSYKEKLKRLNQLDLSKYSLEAQELAEYLLKLSELGPATGIHTYRTTFSDAVATLQLALFDTPHMPGKLRAKFNTELEKLELNVDTMLVFLLLMGGSPRADTPVSKLPSFNHEAQQHLKRAKTILFTIYYDFLDKLLQQEKK